MARAARLWAVAAALLGVALPALSQSSWPAQVVDSAPSGTCSATTYKGAVVVRNTADLWRCLDLDGDSTATWTKTQVVRYQDLDTSGNGTVDYRMVGDYDGDGTLELTDIQSALCDLQGLSVGTVGAGQTGCTGTTSVTDKTLFVLPGTYTGHYRTELTIKAAGLTFMGAGMSATKLEQQDQACSAGSITGPDDSEAIDDGDGTQEQRILFSIEADRTTLSDFSFDGGSGALYDYLAPKMRNRWDCDGDGTDDFTETNTEPPYSCSNYCTRDSASAIDIGDVENTVITRVSLANVNRMFIQAEVDPSARTKDRSLLIDHIVTDRSGEHSFALSTDQVIFSNNVSTRCGPYGSCCYLAPAYKRQQQITNNTFKYFVGSAVCREATGWYLSASAENFVISGNSISNVDSTIDGSARSVLSWGAIAMLGGGTPGTNDRMTISNNEIELKGDICQYGITVQGLDSSNYATGVTISGNSLEMTEQTRSITANTGIFSYYTKDATVSGNTVQMTGDGASGVEVAISVTGSLNTVMTGNVARVSGNGSRPIAVGSATNTMILGNAVDLDPEGTPNETKGIVVASSTGGVIAGNTIKDPEYGIWLSGASRFLVNGNACYDFSNCIVTDSGAGHNRITGNYAFYSGANGYNYSWAWREDQASSTNLWADNQAIRSYLDNGGSQRYPYHGWVWETDENGDATLDSASRIKLFPKTSLAFEGTTENAYQTEFSITDPTADRTITYPNASGDVVLNPATGGYPSTQCAEWDANGQLIGTGTTCGPTAADKVRIGSGAVTLEVSIPDCDGDGSTLSYDTGAHAFGCGDDDTSGTGGSPGGSDTQVQFNDGGSFAGATGMTWNKTTSVATIGTLSSLQVNNSEIGGWLWKIGAVTNPNWTVTANTLTCEGSTEDAFETAFTFADPTADRTVTVPNASGTVQLRASSCTLGGGTTEPAGQQCFDSTYGVLVSDGSNWRTANWSANASGPVWYSGANYEPKTEAAFSYNDSTDTLTVTNVAGNASTSTALATNPSDCSAGSYAHTIAANGNLTCSQPVSYLLSSWHRENIAASGTVSMSPVDAATNTYLPIAPAATIVSLACTNSAVITAGTITFTVYNGTSATDVTVQQTTGTASGAVLTDTACTSNCSLSAGGRLRVDAASAGTVAPTTTDPNCSVVISVP